MDTWQREEHNAGSGTCGQWVMDIGQGGAQMLESDRWAMDGGQWMI